MRGRTSRILIIAWTKDTMNKVLIYVNTSTIVRVHGRCGGKRMVGLRDEHGC